MSRRPVPKGALGDLGSRALTIGPHAGAHRVALRAGFSVLVPLLVLVLLDRYEWTAFAAFGAFTSLYGRRSGHVERAGMQLVAGSFLTLAVVLGASVALSDEKRWLCVVVGSLVAAGGSLVSDAFTWHPPGPLFLVFGFAACATLPAEPTDVLAALVIAAASAAFSMLIGQVGVLREPGGWRTPTLPVPRFGEVWSAPGAKRHLLRFLVGTAVAGAVATAVGGSHPYWAMVAVCAVMGAPDLTGRLTRGLHRVVGTLVGVGVAALILPLHPRGVWAVLVIVALQVGAELLVGRNYALALLCVTPLALMMGQLAHEVPLRPLLTDRALETVFGAAVGIAALFLIPDKPHSQCEM